MSLSNQNNEYWLKQKIAVFKGVYGNFYVVGGKAHMAVNEGSLPQDDATKDPHLILTW